MRLFHMMALSFLASLPSAAAEPIRVTGQVLDEETRAGMAGASIEIFPAWEDQEAVRRLDTGAGLKPLASTRSGQDGSFEITVPGAGLFRLVARAEGRLVMEHPLWPLVEEAALPEVFLQPPQPEQVWSRGPEETGGWWLAESESSGTEAGQRFRVEVRDAEDKPVPGAVVRRGGRAVARTGADGHLEIAIPKGSSWTVEGPDGWRAKLDPPVAGQTAGVRLRPPRTIAGRVVDALSRRPLAGALVWVGRPPMTSPVRTGEDGAFRIAIPAGEELFLEAAAAGYTPLSARPVKPGKREPVVLALEPAATLSGVVVDGAGKPVPGARIAADPPRDRVFPAGLISARSGDDGRFRVTGLRPSGAYRLTVEHEGFARAEVTTRTAPAGQPSEALRIVMGKGQTASGRVVDDQGRPVAGAAVTLFRMTGEGSAGISDKEGKFEIQRLNPGEYDLLVADPIAHPEVAPVHRRGIEIPPNQPVVDLGDVELSGGGVIEGRVVDAQGTPVAGAGIEVFPANDDDGFSVTFADPVFSSQSSDIRTAEDGAFRVSGLQRGVHYYVAVEHPKYVDVMLPAVAVPTAEPLRIVLRPGRSLAGQVVGPAGEPVARARLSLIEEIWMGDDAKSYSSRSLATTDQEGRFRAERLSPGVLTLEVEAEGYPHRRVDGLLLPEDRDLVDLKIVLERGLQLEIQVLNAQGEPVPDVWVQADPESGAGSPDPFAHGAGCGTDAQGRCRIAVPRARVYNLQVMTQGGSVTARVEAAGGITPVEIRLPAGVEVSGRVIGEDEIPVGIAFVQMKSASSKLDALVQPDGSFRFSDVVDGQYRLSAVAPLTDSSSADLEVTVAGRPVRDLELRVQKGGTGTLLTGRVLGLEPGEGRGVFVTAFPEPLGSSGDRLRSGQTSPQGDYRIQDLKAGDWTVEAHTSTGRRAKGNVRIDPGVRAVSLDLEFPPRGPRLSGRVLVDGLPLPNAMIQGRRGPETVVQGMSAYDGSFAIDVQEPGAITLLIGGPQGIGAARSVRVGEDAEISVEIRTGRLRGTVTGPAGEPVEGAVVRIEGWSPEIQKSFFKLTLRGGADGGFEAPRLAAGMVRISVEAPGFAATETLTEVPPGGEGVVEIRLASPDER